MGKERVHAGGEKIKKWIIPSMDNIISYFCGKIMWFQLTFIS